MLPYTQSGSGNALVLLHGFCENKTCFNKQVFLLNKHFTIITIDLPGFGDAPVQQHISIEQMADAVHETLAQLNVSNYVLCGHSMGGYVALALAKKYPDKLKGLVLLHSTATADNEERRLKRDQATAFINEHGAEPYVKNFIPPLFAENHQQEEYVVEFISEALRIHPQGLTAALQAMKNRFDSVDFITQTDMPVAYIMGRHDALIPVNMLLQQVSKLKWGYAKILENSAHMGIVEEPENCAAALKEFTQYCFDN
jgi:pimeloyl-ACP methyl ester carboxylesterase